MSHRIGFPLKRAPESARCAEIFLRAPIGGVVGIAAFRAHLPDFASAPTALCETRFYSAAPVGARIVPIRNGTVRDRARTNYLKRVYLTPQNRRSREL